MKNPLRRLRRRSSRRTSLDQSVAATQVLPEVGGRPAPDGIGHKRRRHLRPTDVIATATLGPRTRLVRA
ncbi:MAG: hypothetical protein LBG11_00790, partial [Bifidobacteriaceae bacterium]|nr:hypothetical protein [Bifidobacteriaceae bacterium]